jgi:haloalkane dehalogenase
MNPGAVDRSAYPFRDRWVELSTGRMHYVDEGSGETVLFMHGTPTWSFEWRHQIAGLSANHRCVAPDLLGFGLSDRPRNFAYTPEAHAAAIAEFAERVNLGRFHLVVHDYGGPIALPLALRAPERMRRLVLINTWMWSFDDDAEMVKKGRIAGGAFGRFMYRHLNFSLRVLMPYAYGDRKKLTPAIYRQYLERFPDAESRGAVLWPLARALLGSSAYYESLWAQRDKLGQVPGLIIWGMRDRAFPPRYLARWRSALPSAQVVEVPSAGHWPHEEEQRIVTEELRKFLSR